MLIMTYIVRIQDFIFWPAPVSEVKDVSELLDGKEFSKAGRHCLYVFVMPCCQFFGSPSINFGLMLALCLEVCSTF